MSRKAQSAPDILRYVRTDEAFAHSQSQDLYVLCQLGPSTVVSLGVWAPLAAGWTDCFALVGAQGELCIVGLGSKCIFSPTHLGFKLAALAASCEALFARSEDGRVFRYSPVVGVVSQDLFQTPPVPVDFPEAKSEVVQIAAGGRHQLALTKGGQLFAWGRNHKGQLGIRGTHSTVSEPVLVKGLEDFTIASVACGLGHCAAVTTDGKLLMWGWNQFGQLGQGHTRDCTAPTLVEGLKEVVEVALGASHTLARSPTCVWACGSNQMGQLGVVPCEANPETKAPAISSIPQSSSTFLPVRCLEASRVVGVACGNYHSAALVGRHKPQVFTWGMQKKQPNFGISIDVGLESEFSAITLCASGFHTCVLTPNVPILRHPRVSPSLQRLLEAANDPSKHVPGIEVTVAPHDGNSVNMRLPVSLLQIRAPAFLYSLTSASASPPRIECETVEGFMSFLHYLVWGTCAFTDLSGVQDVLDLSLRYEALFLATACQDYCEALIRAQEATNQPSPIVEEKKPPEPLDAPISFNSLISSMRAKKNSSPVSQQRKIASSSPAITKGYPSVADTLATIEPGWTRKQAEESLQQFERDMRKWFDMAGDVTVSVADAVPCSLHSCLVESWQTEEKELKVMESVTSRCLEVIKRFVYTGELRSANLSPAERVATLLQAAKWQLDDLQEHLLADLNMALARGSHSASVLLEEAERYNVEPLRSLVVNSLRVNYDQLTAFDRAKLTQKQRREIQPLAHIPPGCSLM